MKRVVRIGANNKGGREGPATEAQGDRLEIQGQRTLSSLCGKDFHQELVAPAGDFALAFDAVFRGMAFE